MLSRRDFIRTGGIALAGLVAAACGKDGGGNRGRTFEDLIAGRRQRFQLLSEGEILVGREERLTFVMLGADGRPLVQPTARAWVAPGRTAEALGPFTASLRVDGLPPDRGIYVARITFPRQGVWQVLAEAPGQEGFGVAEIPVGRQSQTPAPGEQAIAVPTPTVDDHRGVDPICTRRPPCSMHRVSLDDALESGKPTVLIIATPAYCRSRLCGPEVDIVQDVAGDFGDRVGFVHAEVLPNDDPKTVERFAPLSPTAEAWKLVAEPATFFIGASGTIVERFVGPADRGEVRAAVQALLG